MSIVPTVNIIFKINGSNINSNTIEIIANITNSITPARNKQNPDFILTTPYYF